MEYISLAFNQDCYLIGLSGIPDFTITLWNWTKGEKLCSIATGMLVKCIFCVTKEITTVMVDPTFRIVKLDYRLVQKVAFLLSPHLKCSSWNLVIYELIVVHLIWPHSITIPINMT